MSIQCVKCGYSVTEPICALCVVNEVKAWLSEKRVKETLARKIKKELYTLSKKVDVLNYVVHPSENQWKTSIMKCVACLEEMHLLCYYCVTREASQIVKKNLTSRRLVERFQELFNMSLYDLTAHR